MVYRSVDHGWLRKLCEEVKKQAVSSKFKPYAPSAGFSPNMVALATAAVELQEKRHAADYDVMIRMNRSDTALTIAKASAALARFETAGEQDRLAFLSLLLFSPP